MRILLIGELNCSHLVKWANILSDLGNDVCVVSLPNHMSKVSTVDKRVAVKPLRYSGLQGYYFNFLKLNKIAEEFSPDVINCHYASGYGTLTRLAELKKIAPVVISAWGSDVYEFPYQNKFFMRTVCKNLEYADKVASTSVCMAEQIKTLTTKVKDIIITPFGVDTTLFAPKHTQHTNCFNVGIVKTLQKNYNVSMVIEAFSRFLKKVEQKKNKITLHIYGEGVESENLKKQAEKLGISEHVVFHGYIQNDLVADALNNLDVFCLGSVKESFGVSAVEAMACGIPVIASDASGFCEVLRNGGGFIVPQNDTEKMAEILFTLYENENIRQETGNKGRKIVLENYDINKNVLSMTELYRKVIQNNG